jgi:hypothetical protein
MLKNYPQQPWYAFYHFRFEAAREDGRRLTYRTRLPGLSELQCSRRLRELLGVGRYTVAFLGVEEISIDQWPESFRVECGADKAGKPAPALTPKPSAGTPRGGAKSAKSTESPGPSMGEPAGTA